MARLRAELAAAAVTAATQLAEARHAADEVNPNPNPNPKHNPNPNPNPNPNR